LDPHPLDNFVFFCYFQLSPFTSEEDNLLIKNGRSMQIDERDLYRYTDEALSWILPALNLTLGVICIAYALQTQNIW